MDDKRLARIEAGQAELKASMRGLKETIERFMEYEEGHNRTHYKTRDKVLALENKTKGAWFVASIFGTLAGLAAGMLRH